MKKDCSILLPPLCLMCVTGLFAQSDSVTVLKPEKFITKHSIKIDNKQVNYTATADTLIIKMKR